MFSYWQKVSLQPITDKAQWYYNRDRLPGRENWQKLRAGTIFIKHQRQKLKMSYIFSMDLCVFEMQIHAIEYVCWKSTI